jgi:MoxR-like ATPase
MDAPLRTEVDDDVGLVLRSAQALIDNVGRVILGKADQVRMVVAALLARGHVLIEDAPGMGKTLLAKTLARSIGGSVGRVQGTVDLMPADITGVTVFDQQHRDWHFRPGPLFHHVLLFDEINRATPRAQAALLEAMAEGHVTVDGVTRELPRPFFVLATQNPYGEEGTFPLVSGEYDRFAVSVQVGLPDRESERALLRRVGGRHALDDLVPVLSPEALDDLCVAVATVHVAPGVEDYVLDMAAATRSDASFRQGISPRATQMLLDVAKANAALDGRAFVTPDDVQAVAVAVLAHRIEAGHRMLASGAAREAVEQLLTTVRVPDV